MNGKLPNLISSFRPRNYMAEKPDIFPREWQVQRLKSERLNPLGGCTERIGCGKSAFAPFPPFRTLSSFIRGEKKKEADGRGRGNLPAN